MDSNLARLYGHILLITRGKLFSFARLRDIIAFNLGGCQRLIDAYRRPHPIFASITDVSTPRSPGTEWNDGHNIILDSNGLTITLDSLCKAPRLEISHDHNDEYFVSFYRAGAKLATDTIPLQPTTAGGLKVSTIDVPPVVMASGYDRLDIFPGAGDGMYGVGHVRILADSVRGPGSSH